MHQPEQADSLEPVRNERGEVVIFERDELGRLIARPWEDLVADMGGEGGNA
jgi:hypothetical protein